MLYIVRNFGNKKFIPLTGKDVTDTYTVEVNGVAFRGLNELQMSVLSELMENYKDNKKLEPKIEVLEQLRKNVAK